MERKLRVLFCNFEYPPLGGGGGVVNALLAEELSKRHEVTVLTSSGMGTPAEASEGGVRVVRVPVYFRRQQATANLLSMLTYLPMGVWGGKRLLRSERYDIINTHFVLPTGPVGQALADFARIPNVLSVHGGDLYDPSKWTSPHRHWLLRAWVRRLLRQADRVVGQSRNTLENVQQFYAPDLSGVRIPLGIRRPPAEVASRQQYGFSNTEVLLVTVGRLVRRKAIDQLVSVMQDVGSDNTHLLIIGAGPEEKALREQAEQLALARHIHFLGNVDESEKFRVLRMSDAFVSTSQHEGFGLVFLEAMASCLPIVCYDHGGQTDFLADGETGYVLSLNDIAQFTGCCRKLINDRASRRQMGQENGRRVEELFIDHCAARYEALFADVIDSHQRRGISRGKS